MRDKLTDEEAINNRLEEIEDIIILKLEELGENIDLQNEKLDEILEKLDNLNLPGGDFGVLEGL